MKKIAIPDNKKGTRRTIPPGEVYSSLAVILFLFVVLLWLIFQADNYDPSERDVSLELLKKSAAPITLYRAPLKRWSEGEESEGVRKDISPGIFPGAVLRGGWKIAQPVRYFNPKNLYIKINGEAIKFLREGFRGLHYLVLKSSSGNQEISVELYDQGDEKGSRAVFAEYISRNRRIRRRGNSYFITTTAGAIGRKGPFFFRISGNAETSGIRSKSVQVAAAFSALPERRAAEAPGMRVLKEGMRIDPSLIEYRRKNVFQLGYASDFWFGRPDKKSSTRLFVHRSKNAEGADKLIKRLIADQGLDYRTVSEGDDYRVMQHNFLKTFFAIGKKGSYIYGVEKIREKKELPHIMKKFSEKLEE
jgi:hypothetical protein